MTTLATLLPALLGIPLLRWERLFSSWNLHKLCMSAESSQRCPYTMTDKWAPEFCQHSRRNPSLKPQRAIMLNGSAGSEGAGFIVDASLQAKDPTESQRSSHTCPTCTRGRDRDRVGLCLDCAERQALEEEVQELRPAAALQLLMPQSPRVPEGPVQPSLPSSSQPITATAEDLPSSHQDSNGHRSRVSFSLSGAASSRGADNRPAALLNSRKRRAQDLDAHQNGNNTASRSRNGTANVESIEEAPLQTSVHMQEGHPQSLQGRESSVSRLVDSTVSSAARRSFSRLARSEVDAKPAMFLNPEAQPSSKYQAISQLASERLRVLMGDPTSSQERCSTESSAPPEGKDPLI